MSREEVMTVNDLAEYLKLKKVTVYKYAQSGKLPGFKVGASWRFKKATISKWIANQEKKILR